MSDVQTCRCGALPHATNAQRCERGHVLNGNTNAVKHGAWSFERGRGEAALPAETRSTMDVFRDGLEVDLGGAEHLSTIQRGYVSRLTEVEVCCRLLQQDIVRRGLHTPKGRVRSSYDKLLRTIEVWDRLASRLPQGRVARPVSPFDAVKAAVAEANQR
jgi:hypothetical protein